MQGNEGSPQILLRGAASVRRPVVGLVIGRLGEPRQHVEQREPALEPHGLAGSDHGGADQRAKPLDRDANHQAGPQRSRMVAVAP
jgi:hypothetical protein